MANTSSEQLPSAVRDKIEHFARNRADYEISTYKEARARVEFIDPLLAALGWDVGNAAGLSERFKEVVVEPTQDVGGSKRAPDYVLRIGGTPVIFVEAKKPSIKILTDKGSAFQARSYAWSAKLPVVVLTNFGEISIYNGLVKPKASDTARIARLHYFKIDEFESNWNSIAGVLSRDSVVRGDLDRFISLLPKRGGKDRIDKVFLTDLEDARVVLLRHLAEKNPDLNDSELLSAVQLTLDRIIFYRNCEDRGIEPYGTLQAVANSRNTMRDLKAVYESADARYNSGLFHFDKELGRESPDILTPRLSIDNGVMKDIILKFYPPNIPYTFSVMPVEIMGRAYENFLSGEIVRKRGSISIEPKPEVRKSGGVFYTPEWLSRDVVDRVLTPIFDGKSPESLRSDRKSQIRVVDPSCGSGSFLVSTYRYLLDWYLEHYLKDTKKWSNTRPARIEKNESGAWCLSLDERKRILLDHVFGVDLDIQAVEVAKLSLLIVVLEDRSGVGTQEQFAVFKARLLPDLDQNIRCGNSLVGPDFLTDAQLGNPNDEVVRSVRPFDWRKFGKFQAIVGNPPWLMAGYVIDPDVLDYMKSKYESYEGKADLYYLFLERSMSILAPKGRVGMVIPNKMFTTRAARGLRKFLTEVRVVEEIVDFQTEKIFDEATNYTQVLILDRGGKKAGKVRYTRSKKEFTSTQTWDLESSQFVPAGWDTNSPDSRVLWDKLRKDSLPLDSLLDGFGNGVQTGKDPVLILSKDEVKKFGIEKRYIRPWVRGKDIRNGFLAESEKFLIFPYKVSGEEFSVLTESDLIKSPGLYQYLHLNRDVLADRLWFKKSAKQLTGQWWGLMYVDSYAAFSGRHIVTPSLSDVSNFAMGDGRLFPTGTAGVTGLRLGPEQDSDSLLAILNSSLISTFIVAHSSPYQGSYFKFSAPYLAQVPIAQGTTKVRRELISRLGEIWRARMLADSDSRILLDDRINGLVNELYGVSDDAVDAAILQVAPLDGSDSSR